MKIYYIRHNEESLGPYSKDELRLVGVYHNDFVWKGGLGQWTQAKELAELQDILVAPYNNFAKENSSKKKAFSWQRIQHNLKKSILAKLFRFNILPKE
jgi:hypothetical protein